MRTSESCIAVLKAIEGLRLRSYQCSSGHKTIGYGHLWRDSDKLQEPITKAIADALLMKDLLDAETHVERLIDVDLKQCEYDALVSFVYNLGGSRLSRSTLRKKINAKLFDEAPYQIRRWNKALVNGKKRVVLGLKVRREVEAKLFAGGYESMPPADIPGDIEDIRRKLKKGRKK